MTFNCNKCKDTYWVPTENGYRRCECIDLESAKKRWENFGVKPDEVKKIAEYVPFDGITSSLKLKAIHYIKEFEIIKNTSSNGFGILGQSGSGKTHISVGIGAHLLGEGYKAIYMPYLEGMRELKACAMDLEYYIKLSTKYQKAEVLIIDDLFKDKIQNGKLIGTLTEADMKHIYPIINYRYLNRLPIIISTECTADMLEQLDEALAGRIIESCGDNITTIKGSKYNYRMKNLNQVVS